MGAAICSNSNQIVSETSVQKLIKNGNKNRFHDGSDEDTNKQNQNKIERLHEKLWQAIEINDYVAAEKYLDFNDVLESGLYDNLGQTMLHKAASQGQVEILMLLIERTGAKPDIVNGSLSTPLHQACKQGRENIVRFLIGCGVEVNSQDDNGQTPLLLCCIHGHYEILSILIEASNVGHLPEILEVDLANHQGLTPLNCASIKGDFKMVQCLVSRGGANINQTSPKGCTPLIYAGRGGYSTVVEYLVERKASPFTQDSAGGTVLHHAIEKGHIQVLETLLSLGFDVYEAIEIADNAGRTPLFEAVDNLSQPDNAKQIKLIEILTKPKSQNGFQCNPNVINYNGQTPLFSATRQGCFDAIKTLTFCGAKVDLNNGELVKNDEEFEQLDEDEIEEKSFMEAFKSCMTPLQVAAVLGYEEILFYFIQECGADVNLRTKIKGYTTLHLSVLANKPEMIMVLLTKFYADPMIEDNQGRTLLDMIYQYLPAYVDIFQQILEKLTLKKKPIKTEIESIQTDDRQITGVKNEKDIKDIYTKQIEEIQEEEDGNSLGETLKLSQLAHKSLLENSGELDPRIEKIFGTKVALCLASQNWQHKEQALKLISRQTENQLSNTEKEQQSQYLLSDFVEGVLAAVSLTCRDKVFKVFFISLQLFNMVIQSSKVEQDMASMTRTVNILNSEQIISKLLIQSEQSNTRVTNKIHEALLDISYLPQIGEDITAKYVFEQIKKHSLQSNQNHKGLLAQLALLYKLVNSFTVQLATHELDDPKVLNKENILEVILPACSHTKDDIRNASLRILLEVQKQTGSITLNDIESIPQKYKEIIWQKIDLTQTQVQTNEPTVKEQLNQPDKITRVQQNSDLGIERNQIKLTAQSLEKYKEIISEKGQHKDWTQREIALNALLECFSHEVINILIFDEPFLEQCSILLQASLEQNNIQIYLIAIEALSVFINKVTTSETLLDALPSLIQAVVVKTTDTNTRVRKRSVDVVNQVWDIQLNEKSPLTSSQIVANVLCDSQLQEKAIVGRLGLFIKKSILIESSDDLKNKNIQLIMGKDYEQMAQFSCSWCLHKNTKVRQCALKLTVEICRLNSIDSRGQPFKQRIINFILGLRSSIRDPLVKKINEVCASKDVENQTNFINVAQLEFTQVSKARAVSHDIQRVKTSSQQAQDIKLPQINSNQLTVPQTVSGVGYRPTIVLPHSEPLSETQKEEVQSLIELFGLDLITCFYSQTWSSRNTAILKLQEQLNNLDPRNRDVMTCEINRSNFPPEVSFKILLKLFEEGLKDPNLKNYIQILDLIKNSLPIYLRYLRADQIQRELQPLIITIINKTSDLKQKVREASINLCLYLSHQVEIGCDPIIEIVIQELNNLQWEKQDVKKDMTNTFASSNMIISCLNLLGQFQLQTNTIADDQSRFFQPFTININRALRHSNPQIRKEGESLFKIMLKDLGDSYEKELKEQKPQLIQKILQEVKQENNQQTLNPNNQGDNEKFKENNDIEVMNEGVDQFDIASVLVLLKGNEEILQQLRLPNPKKRQIAIVEIKKILQLKMNQMNSSLARELVEPLNNLLRHVLKDENVDVYIEALNLLKFIFASISQHLSTFDLHLMLGQLISLVISSKNQNIKARIATDKVIVSFSKHQSIGSLLIAKEVLKNIERLNKSIKDLTSEEKIQILMRFYSILQMLIQQFSIILCYQPDFFNKCLEILADTMTKANDQQMLKSQCTQLVINLHQIDSKLLDSSVSKLDFTKKTHLKKIIIELENSNQKGFVSQNQMSISGFTSNGGKPGSPDVSFRDTQQSFTSLNSRKSLMSPNSAVNMNRRLQRDRDSEVPQQKDVTPVQETQFQRLSIQNKQSLTGVGWLERKVNDQQTINLPSITNSNSGATKQRRQLGQGFVGGSSKAAGFNRNNLNLT